MSSRIWIALGLVAVAIAIYFQVGGHGFVGLDDYTYVIRNPHLRDGLSFTAIANAFNPYHFNWIPLTALSYQVDFALYGLDPAGYHLTNLAQHALASVLLFLALHQMTGKAWRSAFVAALFAVHPLHVESVAWISERKDTLSAIFWMLTLIAYVHYTKKQEWPRYLLVLVCLGLGLLAKPILVTLPFVLLLLDFWPLERLRTSHTAAIDPAMLRRALIEKIPMLALVVGASIVAFAVQEASGAVASIDALPFGSRIANAILSCAVYIRQTLWPTSLAAFYPHSPETPDIWSVAACALVLLLATAGALHARTLRPYLIVGWLWFLGTLVPVIGLVQVGSQAHADRYMYIPLIGLGICAAWGMADLSRHLRMPQRALGGIAILSLSVLAIIAWRQAGIWRDTETLYRHALSVTEGNYFAHAALGGELLMQNRIDEAERSFTEAARLLPSLPSATLGLADVELARGHLAEALKRYEAAVRTNPENASAAGRYGLALGLARRYPEARVQIARALAETGGVVELHRGMAEVEAALGNPEASVRHGREALRLVADHTDAANNLAWTLATSYEPLVRDPLDAIRLIEAPALKSGDATLLDTLAAAYASAGRYDEAIATANRAADASRDDDLEQSIRARLALYREGRPYIEPKPRP